MIKIHDQLYIAPNRISEIQVCSSAGRWMVFVYVKNEKTAHACAGTFEGESGHEQACKRACLLAETISEYRKTRAKGSDR